MCLHSGHLNVKSASRLSCQGIQLLPASQVSSRGGHAFSRHSASVNLRYQLALPFLILMNHEPTVCYLYLLQLQIGNRDK